MKNIGLCLGYGILIFTLIQLALFKLTYVLKLLQFNLNYCNVQHLFLSFIQITSASWRFYFTSLVVLL